jgi:hypothetical protein
MAETSPHGMNFSAFMAWKPQYQQKVAASMAGKLVRLHERNESCRWNISMARHNLFH